MRSDALPVAFLHARASHTLRDSEHRSDFLALTARRERMQAEKFSSFMIRMKVLLVHPSGPARLTRCLVPRTRESLGSRADGLPAAMR